jgi:pimeloyl-ACP methyl ester carboxylesterase
VAAEPEESARLVDGFILVPVDLRQLLDQLGIKSANVVGHDLGGIVAYVYAAEHRDQVSRLGIIEAPIIGVPSPTMQRVRASYWHIGFYAHPRLPELLIAGRERDYLAEFIRTYQHNREAFDKEDLDESAHHIASPGGLRGMLGVYRAIAAEAQDLIQLTPTKLTVPVWAVGGDHSMGMGPFEQFHHLAETVTVSQGLIFDNNSSDPDPHEKQVLAGRQFADLRGDSSLRF